MWRQPKDRDEEEGRSGRDEETKGEEEDDETVGRPQMWLLLTSSLVQSPRTKVILKNI